MFKQTYKIVLLGIALVIVGFLVIVALQPSHYQVSRSTTVATPPADVFAQVNDFHNWEAWSPWAKLDPNAKNTFEGPASGKGAKFKWSGNDEVGEGLMTVTESKPSEMVKIDLEFIRPFPGLSNVEFTFKPTGDQTTVTWTMSGENSFIGKGMCMFMNMDKMVGGDFERGLASMKVAAEKAAKEGKAGEVPATMKAE